MLKLRKSRTGSFQAQGVVFPTEERKRYFSKFVSLIQFFRVLSVLPYKYTLHFRSSEELLKEKEDELKRRKELEERLEEEREKKRNKKNKINL